MTNKSRHKGIAHKLPEDPEEAEAQEQEKAKK